MINLSQPFLSSRVGDDFVLLKLMSCPYCCLRRPDECNLQQHKLLSSLVLLFRRVVSGYFLTVIVRECVALFHAPRISGGGIAVFSVLHCPSPLLRRRAFLMESSICQAGCFCFPHCNCIRGGGRRCTAFIDSSIVLASLRVVSSDGNSRNAPTTERVF